MRSTRIELSALPPFDFDLLLRYLRIWPAAVLEKIDAGRYRRAVTLDGRDVLLSIHSIGTISKPRLVLEVLGAGVDQAIIERAAALVRRTFSLDADPAPFLQAAQADRVLAELVERLHTLRPIMIIDPFEAALWSILGQQINLAFARRLKQALIELCGSHLEINGERFGVFPKPAQVAGLDPHLARAAPVQPPESRVCAGRCRCGNQRPNRLRNNENAAGGTRFRRADRGQGNRALDRRVSLDPGAGFSRRDTRRRRWTAQGDRTGLWIGAHGDRGGSQGAVRKVDGMARMGRVLLVAGPPDGARGQFDIRRSNHYLS